MGPIGSTTTGARPRPVAGPGVPQELVVLSPLRWDFAWGRPHHLVSRLASNRATWFVEPPLAMHGLTEPRVRVDGTGHVRRVCLDVPGTESTVCFSDPRAASYATHLLRLLGPHGDRAAWLYTPAALPLAEALTPGMVVYDVMDDPSSARNASPLAVRHRQALERADIVFTGGRSLHRAVVAHRPDRTHCLPGGVDPHHFASVARLRRRRRRRVAGYVGVVDARIDLTLVDRLSAAMPDWEIRLAGPVTGIDPADLPRARNITYPGLIGYPDLPRVMAELDVALLPLLLGQTTRTHSPTETLEYLAAGLPVVATPVPDVVGEFGAIVDFQEDAAGFADACRRLTKHCPDVRAGEVEQLLHWNHWDAIAERMEQLIAGGGRDASDGAGMIA